MSGDLPRRIQGALLRIRGDHPFFGTLALFADIHVSEAVPTAATDGETIWFNPGFVDQQDISSLCGLVAHELLHAALQHGVRRGVRDALTWNIAADIVVNGMIRKETAYGLPAGAVEDEKLSQLSVEDVYEQLQRDVRQLPKLTMVDLVDGNGEGTARGDAMSSDRVQRLSSHWKSALQQAQAVAQRIGKGIGRTGLGSFRDVESAKEPTLGWRELLWLYLVSTPYDFGGFDRRFIHRKLYLEDVVGETVEVAICIDTSGSVGQDELAAFMGEVQGILDVYPKVHGNLFFADANLYGPYEFSLDSERPTAQGGGGTDFQPFFNWVDKHLTSVSAPVCIYLTDGYGSFPSGTPEFPVLWVVTSGGLQTPSFPFGLVARLREG
jgi:predicted metal-dependent peptidase